MSTNSFPNLRKCEVCAANVFVIDEGLEICIICGSMRPYLNTMIRSYTEGYHSPNLQNYSHMTCFLKLLRIYQGKCCISEIGNDCWMNVLKCQQKNQIFKTLKRSPRQTKYYEYQNFISHVLFKTKLHFLSEIEENKLKTSFLKVLGQCHNLFFRKTFFPYPFAIQKLLIYHGHIQLAQTIR